MLMINEKTSRNDLLSAIYQTGELIDHCLNKNIDPEFMQTEEIRSMIIEWIESGNEAMGG